MDKCTIHSDYWPYLLTTKIGQDCFRSALRLTFPKPTEEEKNKRLDDIQRADDMRKELEK